MEFEFNPYQGVEPIRFGMDRDEVRRVLDSPFESFMKTPDSELPTDDFTELNLHVFYKGDFECCGVEFFSPSSLQFRGHLVVGRPYSEVMGWLKPLDPSVSLEDSTVTSDVFGFSLYAPDADDDVDSLVQSAYVFARKT
jgi:hypothetical protein